jgi:tRNA(Ile)-lysidine synthase
VSAAKEAVPVSAAEAKALFADLADQPGLVLAVSGGPDSVALLFLAARWRETLKQGPKLLAVTVDHGLRRESAQEAASVGRMAKKLGVTHRVVRWSGKKPVTGLQAAARNARYRLLVDAAHKAKVRHILTAHTLDDQAETVLFRLARGSGLSGLAAMTRTTGLGDCKLIRPLLEMSKARLIATLKAADIPFADDPSNRDPRFTRARLRTLTPALAAEGLDASRLALIAKRMARADHALERAANEAMARLVARREDSGDESGAAAFISVDFFDLPAEIALRLLGKAISAVGDEGPVELGKLETLLEVLRASHLGRKRTRRTLAGAMITVDSARLNVERAPKRRKRS